MTYIVKADIPKCAGSGCRVCEMYLPGFFAKDGGIMVATESVEVDAAEAARQFCPQQCISMAPCYDDGNQL